MYLQCVLVLNYVFLYLLHNLCIKNKRDVVVCVLFFFVYFSFVKSGLLLSIVRSLSKSSWYCKTEPFRIIIVVPVVEIGSAPPLSDSAVGGVTSVPKWRRADMRDRDTCPLPRHPNQQNGHAKCLL